MSSPAAQLASTQVSAPAQRRWTSLAFVSLAQLMVALDATIVNIALPSAQAALHASDADRQWVITAYTLSFGGLLLLGGRLADFFGRKRSFMVGLTGFALASMLGGAAPNLVVLVGARALQGAFGALLAPTALALLATIQEDNTRLTNELGTLETKLAPSIAELKRQRDDAITKAKANLGFMTT